MFYLKCISNTLYIHKFSPVTSRTLQLLRSSLRASIVSMQGGGYALLKAITLCQCNSMLSHTQHTKTDFAQIPVKSAVFIGTQLICSEKPESRHNPLRTEPGPTSRIFQFCPQFSSWYPIISAICASSLIH